MANEYLTRTPTSGGNEKAWTYSVWLKMSAVGTHTNYLFGYIDEDGSPTPRGTIQFNESNVSGKTTVGWNPTGSSWYQTRTAGDHRDSGNWFHFLISVDTTKTDEGDGIGMYFNGAKESPTSYLGTWGSAAAALNVDTGFNRANIEHYINAFRASGGYGKVEYSDFFWVDGQALTPDVFGFYKDGDGYISVSSARPAQATDFRPGQWMPHAPRVIKKSIERSGGFGVNGFYLPMNDSSNPGADFHCAPNSIITLKGEDLPQPRNGAPTTSDAYVSQLREDPYAANLVLAVPGISTSTSANLISNGNFDSSDISDWVTNTSSQTWVNGQLQVTRSGGAGATTYKTFTTEVGKRYTVLGTVNSSGSRGDINIEDGTGWGGSTLLNLPGTNGEIRTLSGSFTAASTTTTFGIGIDSNGTTIFVDNIVVRQEDAPRDYSADIKGSGSNKTLTPSGNAGVGYELGNYYGSAMTFNGTSNVLTTPNSSDFYFDGEFTVECWVNWNGTAAYYQNFVGSNKQSGFSGNTAFFRVWGTSSPDASLRSKIGIGNPTYDGGNSTLSSVNLPTDQWTHVAATRDSTNTMKLFMNGVCVGVKNSDTTVYDFSLQGTAIGQGPWDGAQGYFSGEIQDVRLYKGVAKYKGGFDVPKPYTPVGIEEFRTTADTCKNNFATLNPLDEANISTSNGNLSLDQSSGGWHTLLGTQYVSSGKWYAEMRIDRLGWIMFGTDQTWLETSSRHIGGQTGSKGISIVYNTGSRGDISYNGANSVYTGGDTTAANGDIISIALDLDNNNVKFFKNNVQQYNLDNLLESGEQYSIGLSPYANVAITINYGQNPSFSGQTTAGTNTDGNGKGLFKYAPPSGFLALCEDNLPTPAIADPGDHFKSVLWTGNGSAGRSITGVGFQPDLVWLKSRTNNASHRLSDSVRGVNKQLMSNTTEAEATFTTMLTSFDSDGFTLGDNAGINGSGYTNVAWCWKAGGAAVSNTDGSITSQVSVNQDAGFSIVSWTATGSVTTVGHGLGKKPKLVINKPRTGTYDWAVITDILNGTQQYLYLNSTQAINNTGWGTNPTDSVMSAYSYSNGLSMISYCWAEIEGYSKFGRYLGNASADGPFVYCGFKPAWVLIKKTNGSGNENWRLFDSSRCPTNQNNKHLLPSTTATESSESGMDFLSNGFKLKHADAHQNQDGTTYIFIAFAESPFQTANAK